MSTPMNFPAYTHADTDYILSYCSAVEESLPVPNEPLKTKIYKAFTYRGSLNFFAASATAALVTTIALGCLLTAIEKRTDYWSSLLKATLIIFLNYAVLVRFPKLLYARKAYSMTNQILKTSNHSSNRERNRVNTYDTHYINIYSKLVKTASLQHDFDDDQAAKMETHIAYIGLLFGSGLLHFQRIVSTRSIVFRQFSLTVEGFALCSFIFFSMVEKIKYADPRNQSQLAEVKKNIIDIRQHIEHNPQWSTLISSE